MEAHQCRSMWELQVLLQITRHSEEQQQRRFKSFYFNLEPPLPASLSLCAKHIGSLFLSSHFKAVLFTECGLPPNKACTHSLAQICHTGPVNWHVVNAKYVYLNRQRCLTNVFTPELMKDTVPCASTGRISYS